MTALRALAWLVLALTAVLLQQILIAPMALPGAGPELVVVLTVAAGLNHSKDLGLRVGFLAGLMIDVLSTHPLGLCAAAFAVTGYTTGLLKPVILAWRTPAAAVVTALSTLVAVAAATTGTALLTAAPAALDITDIATTASYAAVWTALVALAIYRPLARAVRLLAPTTTSWGNR